MCWWCLLRIYDISREVLVVDPLAFVVIDVAGRGGCRLYSSHDDDGPRIFCGGRRLLRALWSAHSLSIDISTFVRWTALVPLLYCQGYCALGACAALAALSIDGSRSVAVSSVPSFLAPSYHPATYVVYVVRFTWTSIGCRTFSSLLPLVGLCSVVVPCAPFPLLLPDQHLPPPTFFLFHL